MSVYFTTFTTQFKLELSGFVVNHLMLGTLIAISKKRSKAQNLKKTFGQYPLRDLNTMYMTVSVKITLL